MKMKALNRLRVQPFILLAWTLSSLFEYPSAEEIFIQMEIIFPNCAQVYTEYGIFLWQFQSRFFFYKSNLFLKRVDDSIQKLKKSLTISNNEYRSLNLLFEALYRISNISELYEITSKIYQEQKLKFIITRFLLFNFFNFKLVKKMIFILNYFL